MAQAKKKTGKAAKKKTPAKKKTAPKKKTPVKKTATPKKKTPVKKTTIPKKKTPVKKTTIPKKKTPVKKTAAPKKEEPAKKKVVAKKAAPPAAPPLDKKTIIEEAMKRLPPLAKRINKTDLRLIRKKLLGRRGELAGTLESIEDEHLGTDENRTTSGGDEADQANNAQTADISLRLAETGARELQEIDAALGKLGDGSYGICEATGEPIGLPRLKYIPWIRLSLEAQEKVERNQLRYDESEGWVFP